MSRKESSMCINGVGRTFFRGIATLLLKGDCQPLFEDMEEWHEYLEELVDYDEFEADFGCTFTLTKAAHCPILMILS